MVADLHIVGGLEPVVINVISVCVYLAVFKTFFNQTNMDKKHNYTKKLTFYAAWEPNYT